MIRSRSLLSFFTIISAIAIGIAYQAIWKTENEEQGRKIINSDGLGYYQYLPSLFVYGNIHNQKESEFILPYKQRTVNKYYVGTAVVMSPFFALAVIHSKISGDVIDPYSDIFQIWISIGSLAYLILGLFFLSKFLKLFKLSRNSIAFTLLLIFLGTNLLAYGVIYPSMSHVYSFFCICAFLFFCKKYALKEQNSALYYTALFFALTVLIRPINGIVIFLLPFLFGSFSNLLRGLKLLKFSQLVISIIILVSIWFIQALMWYLQCGNWIIWSYLNEGFYFSNPQIYEVLLGFKKGWLIYTPLVALSFLGFLKLYKRSKSEFIYLLLFLVFLVYIVSSWWNWHYGSSFGQRAFIEYYGMIAFLLAMLISHLKSSIQKIMLGIICLLFVTLNLIQTYQYKTNIISSWDMSYAKYKATFLETIPGKIIIGGNTILLPYKAEQQTMFELEYDFEGSGKYDAVYDSISGSRVADLGNKEYNLTISKGLDYDFKSDRGLYLELSMKVLEKELQSSENSKITIRMRDSLNETHYYYWFHLNETPFQQTFEWRSYNYSVLLPGAKTSHDQLKIYIQNEDKESFYVDDYKVRLSRVD